MKLKSFQYYYSKNRILSKLLKDREIVHLEFTRDKLRLIVFDNSNFGGISYYFEDELSSAAQGYAWIENKEEFRKIIENLRTLLTKEDYDWQKLYFYLILTDYGYRDDFEIPGSTKAEIKEAIMYELSQHLPWSIEECCYFYLLVDKGFSTDELKENRDVPLVKTVRIYSIEKLLVAVIVENAEVLNVNILGITTASYVADSLMEEEEIRKIDFYDSFHNTEALDELRKKYQLLCKAALLLTAGRMEINFFPKRKQRNTLLRLSDKFCSRLGLTFLCMIILMYSVAYGVEIYSRQQLSAVVEKYNHFVAWERRQKEYQNFQKEIVGMQKEILQINSGKIAWPTLLEAFGRIIPNGCWLDKIEEKTVVKVGKIKEKQICLWGRAIDNQAANQFLEGLEDSKYYRLVELVSLETMENKKSSRDIEYFRFKILLEPKQINMEVKN